MIVNHPLLQKIPCFVGEVSNLYYVNFLGARFRRSFGHVNGLVRIDHTHMKGKEEDSWFHNKSSQADIEQMQWVQTLYPRYKNEYFAYLSLAQVLDDTKGDFCILDLGCGYGRWLVNAAYIASHLKENIVCKLIGVEASPLHAKAMQVAFDDNPFSFAQYHSLHAAIGRYDGVTWFPIHAVDDYDQKAYFNWAEEPVDNVRKKPNDLQRVPMVTLNSLLESLSSVDFLMIDLKGIEAQIVEASLGLMSEKVKYVYVCTHCREAESNLQQNLQDMGWQLQLDFSCFSNVPTAYGSILFCNGLQFWSNPWVIN